MTVRPFGSLFSLYSTGFGFEGAACRRRSINTDATSRMIVSEIVQVVTNQAANAHPCTIARKLRCEGILRGL